MLVPLILGSDKTMLSTMSGDKSAWPIYLTVGNLAKEKRRSTKCNGLILIGILPKCPNSPDQHAIKRALHCALREILRSLESYERLGIPIRCADGHTRLGFPRLASWLADYPEQCALTLVIYRWCPRCECDPKEFPAIGQPGSRKRQLKRYSSLSAEEAKKIGQWKISGLENFASFHLDCNIFECMNTDRLHQLLKGVFKDHTWTWVMALLTKIYGSRASEVVDDGFANIPPFVGLRNFGHRFTKVTQWTGSEYKDMLAVWIPLLAPLLKGFPHRLKGLRHLTDFILLAGYHSHTDTTLRYLKSALVGYGKSLDGFLEFRENNSFAGIPKLHAMIHYVECIKEFGSTDNTDTEVSESAHSWLIKDAYRATNKVDYIPQMLKWEKRQFIIKDRLNILQSIADDISDHRASQCQLMIDPKAPVAKPGPPKLSGLGTKCIPIQSFKFPNKASLNCLLDAFCMYLSQLRSNPQASRDLQHFGGSKQWASSRKVMVATGVTTTCQSHNNPDKTLTERARCMPKWRNNSPRYDHILIQGHPVLPGSQTSWLREQGLEPARLLHAFRYNDRVNTGKVSNQGSAIFKTVYHDMIFIEVLELMDSGTANINHGMIRARVKNPSCYRVLSVQRVRKPAHLVPTGIRGQYYINQYINQESYNLIY